jgi:hypothetical protein
MSLGRVTDIRWIHQGKVQTGKFCTAQGKSSEFFHKVIWIPPNPFFPGVIQQLGETGSALTTLVRINVYFSDNQPSLLFLLSKTIAVHIFVVVMRRSRNNQPVKYERIVTCTVVSLTWLFIALFVAISVSIHTHGFTFYEQPVGVSPSTYILSAGLVIMKFL